MYSKPLRTALFFYSLLILLIPRFASAQVSGTVFLDFDASGLKEENSVYNEPGYEGITITGYGANGTVYGPVNSGVDGTYTLLGVNQATRIEFTVTDAWLYSGAFGGTSVQFVSGAASDINFGVNYPADYCQTNPNVIISCYVSGDPLLTNGDPADENANEQDVLVMFPYESSGVISVSTYLANGIDLGAVWGITYQRTEQRVFSASTLKRHTGLGPAGLGGIYVTDMSGVPSNAEFIDVTTDLSLNVGTVPSNSDRGLQANIAAPSMDGAIYDLVGKVGIGDIDISDDESTLWFVNIFDNTLNSLVIDADDNFTTKPTVSDLTIVSIPEPGCAPTGTFRTWGLKYHKEKIYVGGVCDASTSQNVGDLRAIVYEFDNGTFTEILNFPLDYDKEKVLSSGSCAGSFTGWFAWLNVLPPACNDPSIFAYPEPILSDIEFDVNDDMILGFMDRFSSQVGTENFPPTAMSPEVSGNSGGDILKATKTSTGYVIEDVDANGEFYDGDRHMNTNNGNESHAETAQGGLALLPGYGEVLSVAMDPVDGPSFFGRGGVIFLNNTTGDKDDGYEVYTNADGFFGKANGLGDIELLCNAAPVEIGNRVWLDVNGDGIQDGGEGGLSGVQVQLFAANGTTLLATATTDANGSYIFSNSPDGTSNANFIYNITTLQPNTSYVVKFPMTFGGDNLTTANAGSKNTINSDANAAGEIAVTTTDIARAGANNHSFDVGYTAMASCSFPMLTASAVQTSCTDGIPNADGYLQISAVTNGDRVNFSTGNTYTGDADYANATVIGALPFQFANGLANPSGTQNYTIRVFNTASDCFTDVTVTLERQDCAVGCNCTEYVYLNEPSIGSTLKFEVGSGIPLTEVLGANGGSAPDNHWYPGLGTSEMSSPHGLAVDLNGRLYIGSTNGNSNIRQLTCDGEITPVNATTIFNPGNNENIFSIGNTIYVNTNGGPSAYNSCTGELIGQVCFNDADVSQWGLSYNAVTEMVYATQTIKPYRVWAFTKAELEAGVAGTGACIDPLITMGNSATVNPGDMFLPNSDGGFWGIVADNSGDIYLVKSFLGGGSSSSVYKYNSSGEFIAKTPDSPLGGAYGVAIGIIWSESSNRLYVSNFTDDLTTDCISAFDASAMTYLGTAAPNPGLPVNNTGKALAIIKECCPVNLPSTFQKEVCGGIGVKFFLNEEAFDLCDGTVCGSSWTPTSLNGMTFDACDNSVLITGTGCSTFTLDIGAVSSTGCTAQASTFTICNSVIDAEVTANVGTCTGTTANNNATINIASVVNADVANFSTGATYTGPAYGGAGQINVSSGSGSITGLTHNTEYTVRIFNGSNDCYVDYTVMTPSIDCTTPPTASCNCKEYIYLNEPAVRTVLKFEVDPNNVVLTEVMGANGGPHWYPGAGVSELPSPHGLASDLNGNLYIGAAGGDSAIRKFDCDGNIQPTDATTINTITDNQNMFSIGNTLYHNSDGGPTAYDLCTGDRIGKGCYNGVLTNNQWGLSYNPVTEMVYATDRGSSDFDVWTYSRTQLEAMITADNGTMCIDPLISVNPGVSTINPGDMYIPDGGQLFGIVGDNDGNFYIAFRSGSSSILRKYSASGAYISSSPTSSASGDKYDAAAGIVWSDITNKLYVSNLSDASTVDCISVFDAVTMNYLGTGAPNPDLPTNNYSKAIAITKECCPVNLPTSFNREVCGAIGTKFFLNEEAFSNCDGLVCGSNWAVSSLQNMTFDACESSVVVSGTGCSTFTLDIGAVASTGCSPQNSTFTICNSVIDAEISAAEGVCTATGATNDASISISNILNVDKAGISVGNIYNGPIYSDVGTIDISGGSGTFNNLMHDTYHVIRIFNGSNDCYFDEVILTPNLLCCEVSIVTAESSECIDNGTRTDPSDDYFTINVNATARDGGAQYQVVLNANNDGMGGTVLATSNYGTVVTVGTPGMFVADGMTTYVISIRDATTNTCFQNFTTTIVESCSNTLIDYPDYEDPVRECANSPCHEISTDIYLGSSVDGETSASGSTNADSDVDDGLMISPNMQFTPSNTVRLPVIVYNNTGNVAHLRMWIDWNGDGDFEDNGEQVEDTTRPSLGAEDLVLVEIIIPLAVIQNQGIAVRTRLSTDDTNSNAPCGAGVCAIDGEIEDYLIEINCPISDCVPVQLTVKKGNL